MAVVTIGFGCQAGVTAEARFSLYQANDFVDRRHSLPLVLFPFIPTPNHELEPEKYFREFTKKHLPKQRLIPFSQYTKNWTKTQWNQYQQVRKQLRSQSGFPDSLLLHLAGTSEPVIAVFPVVTGVQMHHSPSNREGNRKRLSLRVVGWSLPGNRPFFVAQAAATGRGNHRNEIPNHRALLGAATEAFFRSFANPATRPVNRAGRPDF